MPKIKRKVWTMEEITAVGWSRDSAPMAQMPPHSWPRSERRPTMPPIDRAQSCADIITTLRNVARTLPEK